MKKLLATMLLFVAINPLGFGQVQSNLELLDIFNMEYVSDPQISPDGSKIIYVRNFKDVMTDRNLSNLWIINFAERRIYTLIYFEFNLLSMLLRCRCIITTIARSPKQNIQKTKAISITSIVPVPLAV